MLKWFDLNRRKLPWRPESKTKYRNPYKILVSEIMLQQTTVGTVEKRYKNFIKLWPTVEKLSKARKNTLLKFWSGLGYYRRAINLLKCSKIIRTKYKSKIPRNTEGLVEPTRNRQVYCISHTGNSI